jgi:hypothetical protein
LKDAIAREISVCKYKKRERERLRKFRFFIDQAMNRAGTLQNKRLRRSHQTNKRSLQLLSKTMNKTYVK